MSAVVEAPTPPKASTPPEVDLVNAALLGTQRRTVPVPAGTDPAAWLLEAAALRRAGTLVAGATTVVRPGPPGPEEPRPLPSDVAREVLDDLLLGGSTALVDLWLREACAAGVALAPEHWTPLLDRARRATDLDRHLLGDALGERGLWFARHNPAWAAVVRAATTRPATPVPVDLAALAAQPERLLTLPGPWPAGVVGAAVRMLASGALPRRTARALGQRVGTCVPLATYATLAALPEPSDDVAAVGLGACEEVLWARWGLAKAFDPTCEPPNRVRPEEHR